MKKIDLKILFYLLLLFSPLIIEFFTFLEEEDINLNPNDYARISDVDYTAVVDNTPYNNGKVVVTELLTFDIHAASRNNPFWELWRDLVEDGVDGLKVSYNVNYVNQILPNGQKIPYEKSPKLYWNDSDYTSSTYGPGKWYHSKGPYYPDYRQYECVFFYVDGLYREKPVFEINYDMYNAVLKYNDCSELYLSLYSEDTINYLNTFKGQILVPNENMPKAGNYDAHTYGTNSNSFPFKESNTKNPGYHTFSFELDKEDLKFSPYNEYIEFSLVSHGEDKHIFSKYANRNYYTDDNVLDEIRDEQREYDYLPTNYFRVKLIVFIICLFMVFKLIRKLLKTDDNIEKKYTFYKPTMQVDYFRDIPSNLDPAFAATLAFCKHKKIKDYTNIYSAILLSLIRKKYIEINKIDEHYDWEQTNTNIAIKYKPKPVIPIMPEAVIPIIEDEITNTQDNTPCLEPLTRTEEYYFNLILKYAKDNDSITMKKFQDSVSMDYENTDAFVRSIAKAPTSIGVSEKYFQKADYEEPKTKLKYKAIWYALLGIFILTVVNFISYQTRLDFAFGGFTLLGITYLFGAFICKYLSKKYILLSQFGEDEYVKWHGLYKFLNSETLMKERSVIELPLWEQYLVYATAFGISEKVITALKIRCPDADITTSNILNNSTYFRSAHFHSSCHSFGRAAHHASSFASSGGYGGHGGYGGGGRGGGGGRRWTLINKIKRINLKVYPFLLF